MAADVTAHLPRDCDSSFARADGRRAHHFTNASPDAMPAVLLYGGPGSGGSLQLAVTSEAPAAGRSRTTLCTSSKAFAALFAGGDFAYRVGTVAQGAP